MNNTMSLIQLTKRVEDIIILYLQTLHSAADKSLDAQNRVRLSRPRLYFGISKNFSTAGAIINVVLFNRIIDDLKKAGLVGTTTENGEHFIFFTAAGRKHYVEPILLEDLEKKSAILMEAAKLGVDVSKCSSTEREQLIADAKAKVAFLTECSEKAIEETKALLTTGKRVAQ
jgi:hypothetical protein